MAEDSHCLLIRETMKAFELEDEAISVAAYRDNSYAVQMLERHGFNLNTEGNTASSGVRFQLDTFDLYKGERCIAKRNDYGGIKIERRDQGRLRNSHELAVAVLTVGFSVAAAQNSLPHTIKFFKGIQDNLK